MNNLHLLEVTSDGVKEPAAVFDTPELAKAHAQALEDEAMAEDTAEDDAELEWLQVRMPNGDEGWATEFDMTYTGDQYVVSPINHNPDIEELS